jgi:hypothetical protein
MSVSEIVEKELQQSVKQGNLRQRRVGLFNDLNCQVESR